MMRNVLVTGGAGFIGSHLVELLVADGARVTVVDNLVTGLRRNLTGVLGAGCRLVVADIRDGALVDSLLEGVDTVFHLACLGVRHSIHSPVENHEVNATASLHLLEAARRAGVGRFVHVSSSEVYGSARTVPMGEDHPTCPMTVYGASKLAGEAYARAQFHTYGFHTVVVRPFNAYGPRSHHEGDSGEVIPKFTLRGLAGRPLIVFGDGEQTRDFTYVEDTARGIRDAGTVPEAVGMTINLGSGQEISINALAREVAGVLGRQLEVQHAAPRPGDVRRLYADSRLASRVLGFASRVGLREGLSRLRDWYASSGTPVEELLAQERVQNWLMP